MDPVTHTALGAVTGYAVFGRQLGRMAAGIGALAALVPDADVFIRSAQDPLLFLEYHRQFTHSLLFSVAGAAVVAGLWLRHSFYRRRWLTVWLCAWVAYVGHCLLDAATTYGTQLYWPFSDYRVGGGMIAIVDPIATGVLLVGLGWALIGRAGIPARVALGLFLAYIAVGGVQRTRAAAGQEVLARQRGHSIERSEVMPTLGNNIVWRSLYEYQGRLYSDRIRAGWFTRVRALEGGSVLKATLQSLTPVEQERNRAVRAFQRFAWFSDHWVARVPADLDVIGDMRYSVSARPFDPLWGIRFTPPGAPEPYRFEQLATGRRLQLGSLWSEINGTYPGYRRLGDGRSVAAN